MSCSIVASSQFKRDLALAIRRSCNIALLDKVVSLLAAGEPLPPKYRDHTLSGNYRGKRECHITGDWLLIYERDGATLNLHRTGSHSDLFR